MRKLKEARCNDRDSETYESVEDLVLLPIITQMKQLGIEYGSLEQGTGDIRKVTVKKMKLCRV